MVAKHSEPASIVPFIKAFKPNMKLMHDIHIWPTDVHIHDTPKSHGGLLLNPPSVFYSRNLPNSKLRQRRALYLGE